MTQNLSALFLIFGNLQAIALVFILEYPQSDRGIFATTPQLVL
jgi:hypothetical protein